MIRVELIVKQGWEGVAIAEQAIARYLMQGNLEESRWWATQAAIARDWLPDVPDRAHETA